MKSLELKNITLRKLLIYIFPTFVTTLFVTFYSIVDGAFVARYVGTDALAAVNIVYPIANIMAGIGIMFACGGTAIVAMTLGENNKKLANKQFTLCLIVANVMGLIIAALLLMFFKPILGLLGATAKTYDYAYIYGLIWIISFPTGISKDLFVYFIRVDGNPKYSMIVSCIGGIINIILDYVLIRIIPLGIAGAGIATAIGLLISCLLGAGYFISKKSHLKFVKPTFDFEFILASMGNGSSEMVTQLSIGITTLAFNLSALKFVGEDGVAAVSVILYLQFIFISAFIGFTNGVAPLISYNYGAEDIIENKRIMKCSGIFIPLCSVAMFICVILFSDVLVTCFAQRGTAVFSLAKEGMRLFGLSFLFIGVNIFASGMFTAYGNGKISAIIASLHSLIFLIGYLVLLPIFFGINGMWLSVAAAEITTIAFSFFYLIKYRNQYHY